MADPSKRARLLFDLEDTSSNGTSGQGQSRGHGQGHGHGHGHTSEDSSSSVPSVDENGQTLEQVLAERSATLEAARAAAAAEAARAPPAMANESEPMSDEETITLTAYEVLAMVEKAWLNEKQCMELLCPLNDETDVMLEQMRTLEKNWKSLNKRDLRLPIHQMEKERIRFVITSYYKTRLNKIQNFPWFHHKQDIERPPGKVSRLTRPERKFLDDYMALIESHMKTLGTQHMPQPSQKMPEALLQFQPNQDSFVFFKSHIEKDIYLEDADGEGEDITLAAESMYIMRYRAVRHLLIRNNIELM